MSGAAVVVQLRYHAYICLRDWGRPRISSGGCVAFHGSGTIWHTYSVSVFVMVSKVCFQPAVRPSFNWVLLTVCAAVCIYRPSITDGVCSILHIPPLYYWRCVQQFAYTAPVLLTVCAAVCTYRPCITDGVCSILHIPPLYYWRCVQQFAHTAPVLLTVCAAVCIYRPWILNYVIYIASSILPNEWEFSIIGGANFDVLPISTRIRAAAMCNSASYHYRNSMKVMKFHGRNEPKYLHVQICDILETVM